MSYSVIAAVADRDAIGHGGDLAFHIPADLRRFKQLTMGHAVVMGRRTFESLPGGALPGRRNIVITRSEGWSAPGVEVAASLADALDIAGDGAFVIGGGQIYAQAIDGADTLYITRVYAACDGADTFFPPLPAGFRLVESSELFPTPVPYRFLTYRRE